MALTSRVPSRSIARARPTEPISTSRRTRARRRQRPTSTPPQPRRTSTSPQWLIDSGANFRFAPPLHSVATLRLAAFLPEVPVGYGPTQIAKVTLSLADFLARPNRSVG